LSGFSHAKLFVHSNKSNVGKGKCLYNLESLFVNLLEDEVLNVKGVFGS